MTGPRALSGLLVLSDACHVTGGGRHAGDLRRYRVTFPGAQPATVTLCDKHAPTVRDNAAKVGATFEELP